MKPYSLPKKRLLTKTWEYETVYRQGKRLRGRHFSLILAANNGRESRLGVSVHGFKKAAERNRVKRITREFFRLNRAFLPQSVDIVFTVRPGFAPANPGEVKEAVQELLDRARMLPGSLPSVKDSSRQDQN